MKQDSKEIAKKYKSYTYFAIFDVIFTKTTTYEIAKEACDKLIKEFQGSDKTRQI